MSLAIGSRGLPTSASVLLITDEVVPRLLVPPRPDRALLTVAPGTLGTAFTPAAAGEDTALSQLSGHVRPSPRLPVWTGNIELRGTGIAPGLYAGVWQNGCVRRGVCVCVQPQSDHRSRLCAYSLILRDVMVKRMPLSTTDMHRLYVCVWLFSPSPQAQTQHTDTHACAETNSHVRTTPPLLPCR